MIWFIDYNLFYIKQNWSDCRVVNESNVQWILSQSFQLFLKLKETWGKAERKKGKTLARANESQHKFLCNRFLLAKNFVFSLYHLVISCYISMQGNQYVVSANYLLPFCFFFSISFWNFLLIALLLCSTAKYFPIRFRHSLLLVFFFVRGVHSTIYNKCYKWLV